MLNSCWTFKFCAEAIGYLVGRRVNNRAAMGRLLKVHSLTDKHRLGSIGLVKITGSFRVCSVFLQYVCEFVDICRFCRYKRRSVAEIFCTTFIP